MNKIAGTQKLYEYSGILQSSRLRRNKVTWRNTQLNFSLHKMRHSWTYCEGLRSEMDAEYNVPWCLYISCKWWQWRSYWIIMTWSQRSTAAIRWGARPSQVPSPCNGCGKMFATVEKSPLESPSRAQLPSNRCVRGSKKYEQSTFLL